MNCWRNHRRTVLAGLFLGLFILTTNVGHADTTSAVPAKVVTIEGITEYRLGNGLRLLLFPDDSTPNFIANLVVLVGSRQEGYGETGMAHLLEHMLFKGTPTHKDIPKLLKDRGARYNASTAYDRTNYFEMLAGTDDNLDFALRMEADRFVKSLIRREDLNSEMTVVRSEFEQYENSPQAILRQRMMAVAYEWHNYGKAIIGNRSDIERVPIDRLQAFYHKYYRPDNAVLVIAGKFKPEKALALVQKYFGALKRPAVKLEATYTDEPPQDGERTVVLRRVGKVGLVGAMYHIPSVAHADSAPLQVLGDVLDAAPSGRLYKALVETNKATGISTYAFTGHDPGLFMVQAQLGAEGSEKDVRAKMLSIIEGIGQTDIARDEVERVKRKYAARREQLMSNSIFAAMSLTEWIANGDWRLFFLQRDRMAKVTPADVKRVAAKYLLPSNRTVGVYIPTEAKEVHRATVPETPVVAALVKDYRGGETVAMGEDFDPTPANIEKRVKRTQIAPGIKVAVLPRKSRGHQVVAELTLRYGNEKSLTGKTLASRFLGTLMLRGTKSHTRQQLQDALDKLGARLMPAGSAGQLTFVLQCKRQDLPAAIRLLGEVLREPTFPQEDFDILKRRMKVGLEQSLTDPHALAARALERRLKPYPSDNIRYTPTLPESIARLGSLTRAEIVKLYREQLGAGVGELAIVGDFDPESTLKEFGDILNGWKSSVPVERIAEPAQTDIPGGRDEILTPDKKNAYYMAGLMTGLKDSDSDYPALKLANYILGGGGLSSRLANRVRQQEGLSYHVSSSFSADARDRSASFSILANCKPTNIDKLDKAVAEELGRFIKDGVDAKELADAKNGYLQQMQQQWSGNQALATILADGLYEGRTFAYYARLRKAIADLTPETVANAFRKHIEPKRLVIIRAGDFKKKAKVKAD